MAVTGIAKVHLESARDASQRLCSALAQFVAQSIGPEEQPGITPFNILPVVPSNYTAHQTAIAQLRNGGIDLPAVHRGRFVGHDGSTAMVSEIAAMLQRAADAL